jgi:NAD(P)-dependent dehydrogenase (short-subunit alcohol dehydrogenase family)
MTAAEPTNRSNHMDNTKSAPTDAQGILQGKVAVVTGAGGGIGRDIALAMAREGARVVVNDIGAALNGEGRDAGPAQAVVDEIKALGGQAAANIDSVADPIAGRRMVECALDAFGRLDIVVNNAGVFHTVPVMETTEEIWDAQLDLNLKACFFMVKMLVPHFRENGGGKVINITSIAGTGAFPNCPAYCASKGGLVNLTRALAAELGKEQINVNSIAPGNVATPLNAHLRGPGNEQYMKLMRTLTPTGIDFIDAEDMTGTAVFLATDDARMIHGETIIVDAGWSVW